MRAVILLALGSLLVSPLAAQAPTTEVVLLGTGMPRPNPAAAGPATAVVTSDQVLLFDAGRAVLQQMDAAHLPLRGPTAAFITHLHSDHTVGLPDLILTSWVMQRHRAMPVYGPPGLASMIEHIYRAWAVDIRMRTEGLEAETPGGERVAVHEIGPGVVYDSAGVRVTAFRVPHGNFPDAMGFKVETPSRVIVISGDTGPSEEVERQATGADVLVHEVYSAAHLKPEARPGGQDWPAYMHAFHTSDVEVGRIAQRAGVKLLVLTHIIRMGATDEELIAGVRQGGYTGPVVVGKDLGRY